MMMMMIFPTVEILTQLAYNFGMKLIPQELEG